LEDGLIVISLRLRFLSCCGVTGNSLFPGSAVKYLENISHSFSSPQLLMCTPLTSLVSNDDKKVLRIGKKKKRKPNNETQIFEDDKFDKKHKKTLFAFSFFFLPILSTFLSFFVIFSELECLLFFFLDLFAETSSEIVLSQSIAALST
jgi:hypothetical protein